MESNVRNSTYQQTKMYKMNNKFMYYIFRGVLHIKCNGNNET